MKLFHHKHHFFGHNHHRKVRHRIAVLFVTFAVLLGLTSAIGIYFGMDPFAVFPLAILFCIVGVVGHVAVDHH
jgi:hypothetical protein